ncbi:hypothetical protein NECAME_19496 [Necator americanus]|uniref:Uncharacterized protein n=1 Tax=Necator americanus TaxID=51031 RepID=W2SGN7_NECAM|nr:hypothetical protein NECAME_19496 [Necator americanus]ETN68779.1 hypothetical protein NECAME_19496 [Necator americanus]
MAQIRVGIVRRYVYHSMQMSRVLTRAELIVLLALTLLGYWSSPTPRQHGSRHG